MGYKNPKIQLYAKWGRRGQRGHRVLATVADLRKRINLNQYRRSSDRKRDGLRRHFNKAYRKLDFNNTYCINEKEAKKVLDDENFGYAGKYIYLKNIGAIKPFGKNEEKRPQTTSEDRYVKLSEIKYEMFKRELCIMLDTKCWRQERRLSRNKKIRDAINESRAPVYMMVNGEKVYLGKFSNLRMGTIQKMIKLLQDNLYVFDKNSEYYLEQSKLRYLLNWIFTRNIDKITDFKKYIKDFLSAAYSH